MLKITSRMKNKTVNEKSIENFVVVVDNYAHKALFTLTINQQNLKFWINVVLSGIFI